MQCSDGFQLKGIEKVFDILDIKYGSYVKFAILEQSSLFLSFGVWKSVENKDNSKDMDGSNRGIYVESSDNERSSSNVGREGDISMFSESIFCVEVKRVVGNRRENVVTNGEIGDRMICGLCCVCLVDSVYVSCGHLAGCSTCLNNWMEQTGRCMFCSCVIERVL